MKGFKKRKLVTFDDSDDEDSDQGRSGKKFCQYHDTCRHITDQCTTLKALVKHAKQKKSMVQQQVKKALKKKKK